MGAVGAVGTTSPSSPTWSRRRCSMRSPPSLRCRGAVTLAAVAWPCGLALSAPPRPPARPSPPQPLWPDVLAILEQLVCIFAPAGFVGTLPSTLSGHIVNARELAPPAGATPRPPRPLFRKLHESCCDARTAEDLLKLPRVRSLADVPCYPHEGNSDWC